MKNAEIKRLKAVLAESNKQVEARIAEVEAWLDSFVESVANDILISVQTVEPIIEGGKMQASGLAIARNEIRIKNAFEKVRAWTVIKLDELINFLLDAVDEVSKYFESLGFKKAASIAESVTNTIRAVIGLEGETIVAGGFIDNLASMSTVREGVLSFARLSAASGIEYSAYQSGVKSILQNSGIVGDYFRRYAYDAYNEVREIANVQFAEGLGLKYFIYEGSVISTTRKFCSKKAGKVFSTEEAKKWKNDPDLIEQSTKATYKPLIERGRYNCRHFINYISDELAFVLRPDLKEVL